MALTLNNNLLTLKTGDYFWCKYVASSGVFGVFSDIATKTDAIVGSNIIPPTSSATPNGYFKYICVGVNLQGNPICIPDRNIQHSISWDAINTKGIVYGFPTNIDNITNFGFNIKLISGGINSSDTDNMWDKIIVGSTLNNNITAGDNSIWNWSGISSWTSTTISGTNTSRVIRGNTTAVTHSSLASGTSNATTGFRPLLIIESLNSPPVLNSPLKTLINNNTQVQLSAISVSDSDSGNTVKYQVSIKKPDNSVIIKRAYDTSLQSSPLTFDTLTFDNGEFDIGINTITVDTMDNNSATNQWTTTVAKTNTLKLLIQDGVKWRYISSGNFISVLSDYTVANDIQKETAFLTYGMATTIDLTSGLNSQIENPSNVKIVMEKIGLLS